MRYLVGEAEKEGGVWMQCAATVAMRAQCRKARCGAVIVRDGAVIGEGFNAPPLNDSAHSMCDAPRGNGMPKYDQTCCMHAEWRAILDAVRRNPEQVPGSSLYFVRVDDHGVIKPSQRPYCTVCSRMALDVGISHFLLQFTDGIGEYPTDEYNRLSYAYIPVKTEVATMDIRQPLVGVGVMIVREGRVLMTKRKGSHGAGMYSFPGGHLEHGETFEQCAIRETREEAGIKIKDIQFQYATNSRFYLPKHYVHIGMIAAWKSGEARVMEPDKAEAWDWYPIAEPPPKLFGFCQLAFRSYRTGEQYFSLPDDCSFRVAL